MKRCESWLCALDPTVSSEIQKTRPCVIVSPDELNGRLRTVIVAPMTTGSGFAPFPVAVAFQGKAWLILPEQQRSIDRDQLVKHVGKIGDMTLATLLRTMGAIFA